MWTEERLNELAQQCRMLARQTETGQTKDALLALARDYELKAMDVQQRQVHLVATA